MSAINGDKSRFNRERKEKIARRARNRARFKNLKSQPSLAAPAPARKSASVAV